MQKQRQNKDKRHKKTKGKQSCFNETQKEDKDIELL